MDYFVFVVWYLKIETRINNYHTSYTPELKVNQILV